MIYFEKNKLYLMKRLMINAAEASSLDIVVYKEYSGELTDCCLPLIHLSMKEVRWSAVGLQTDKQTSTLQTDRFTHMNLFLFPLPISCQYTSNMTTLVAKVIMAALVAMEIMAILVTVDIILQVVIYIVFLRLF